MKGGEGPRLQFDSCAEKNSLFGTVMMAWIQHVWINAIVFGCLFPWHKLLRRLAQENCCKVYSQSKFDPWVYILVFAEGDCCRFASESLPTEAGLCRIVDITIFLCFSKQQPRFPQGQPNGYFLSKELDRTTEAFARMNVVWEGPVCWVQCANMWRDCSLTAVQRKTACVEQSWWPEFKVFGSMPWCSGVCSYGTSSSEGWRKTNVVKSTVSLNLIHEFTSLFSPKVIVAGLPRKAFQRKQAFVDISVFLWLRKQQPRFAQGQPKGYFQTKELDRTTEAFARMNVV